MRKFLRMIMIFLCLASLISCSGSKEKSYTKKFYSMGTVIAVTIYSSNETAALDIIENVQGIYDRYDAVADYYYDHSGVESVHSLNEKRSVTASAELLELVSYALEVKEETNGYFEPLIGSLSEKWKNALFPEDEQEPSILSTETVNEELAIIANSEITISDSTITITGEANLDLGGVAKGYATQKVYEYFTENGVTKYLVNAGNSNILCGMKPDGSEFNVAVTKTFVVDDYLCVVTAKNKAIVTSSIKEQYIEIDEEIYHHIISSKTGMPINYYDTVVILGENSGLLDAYSTAIFSMDLDTAKDFLKDKNLDVYFFKNDTAIYSTVEGWNE